MTDDFKGRGYQLPEQDRGLYVGRLPDRKKVCLYEAEGSVIRVLARADSPEAAEKLLEWLDMLLAGYDVDTTTVVRAGL